MNKTIYNFASGLRLVYQNSPYVRSVGISVLTGVGSGNETVDNNGISHFIEHMFFKGTANRSAFEIVEFVDGIGAQINAFTSKQNTCFYTLSVDNKAENCAEVLSDILFNSTFDKEEMEREKAVVLEEISMSDDDNGDLSLDMVSQAYFGKNSLAKTILGPRKNIKNFSREEIIKFIDANYCAKDTVIAIVGNISFDNAKTLVEKYFEGKFNSNCKREWADVSHVTQPKYVKKFKNIEQANISIAMPSLSFSDEDDMAQMLVNTLVGGGMSSRLFQEIREKSGLAYNVYTYPSSYVNNGMMSIYIGTNPDSATKAVELTKNVINKLRKDGLGEAEFDRGVQQLVGAYVLGQESTGSMMRVLSKYALYNNELFDIDSKLKKINSITLKQANDVIERIYDLSKASVAYVGKKMQTNLLDLLKD